MTIKSTIETLSETELDFVAGGVQQNEAQDRQNKHAADLNSADGLIGGSIGNVNDGLVVKNGGPYSPGHPFDWP